MENDWRFVLALTDSDFRIASAQHLRELIPQRWTSVSDGAVALGCGDTGLALRLLDEAFAAAERKRDGAQALLAACLGNLAEMRQFNLLPGGGGADSVELLMRWNGPAAAQRFAERCNRARELAGHADAAPARRWLDYVVQRLPAIASIRSSFGGPFTASLLQLELGRDENARDAARELSPGAEAFVDRSLAEVCMAAGEVAQARAILDRSIGELRAAGDDHTGLAAALALRGDLEAAPLTSGTVSNLRLSESGPAQSDLGAGIEAQEGAAEGLDLAAAHDCWERALEIFRRAGAPRGEGAVLLRLAHLSTLEGRPDRALQLLESAQDRFTRSGDSMQEKLARVRRAIALVDLRRRADAREAVKGIGDWSRAHGSFSYGIGLGLLFTRAARQYQVRLGDAERSEACFELALSLDESLGARQRAAQSRADLAALYRALGHRDLARTQLEAAIDTIAADSLAKGRPQPVIGERAAMLVQGLYQESLEHRDGAGMRIAIERLDKLTLLPSIAGMAILLLQKTARAQAEVLVPLYEGVAARNEGEPERAEKFFDEALALAERSGGGDRDYLLAIVHGTCRRYDEALEAWDRYRAATSGTSAVLANTFASLLERMQPAAASAMRLARRRNEEQHFTMLVRMKAFERAAESLATIKELGGESWWKEDARPWLGLSDIGEMQEGLGRFEAALQAYERAIAELEARRRFLSRDELKTALGADLGGQYLFFNAARTALALADRARTDEERREARRRAFEFCERSRARALLDLLAANVRRASGGAAESEQIRRWRELSGQVQLWTGMLAQARAARAPEQAARVQQLEKTIAVSVAQLEQLEREIAAQQPDFAATAVAAEVASLDDVASLLAPDTALLQYMSVGPELLVWAITREGMTAASRLDVPQGLLAGCARRFRDACSSGSPLALVERGVATLVKHLLEPLAGVLDDHRRLVLVPHADLHLVPFAALPWKGAWLGETHVLSYLPSASTLPLLPKPRVDGARPALVVGDPSRMAHVPPFGTEQALGNLELSRAEAKNVAALLGTKPLVGDDATIGAVEEEAPRCRILHFATHGLLYPEAPLLSGIALAHGEVLSVFELMALHLQAELVTLSACNTALGVRTGGDEVLGVTRALIAAGARSAVVTLWPVFDGSTAVLMTRFYERLTAGDGAAAALAAAQGAVRKLSTAELNSEIAKLRDAVGATGRSEPLPGIHPRHWAAFMLVGGNV